MSAPRQIAQQAVTDAYNCLGADVEYHRLDSSMLPIKAIDSTEIEFVPGGYESSASDDKLTYNVQKKDVPLPVKGEYIIDDSEKFDIVEPPEKKDRFEWILTVKKDES